MKNTALFLGKILLFSLLLYAVADLIAAAYDLVLLGGLTLLRHAPKGAWGDYYDSALRTIPFIALLLATPALTWKRRLLGLLVGLAAFWSLDLISTIIWDGPPSRNPAFPATRAHILYSLIWDLLGHWVLPCTMWMLVAHKQLATLLRPAR